MAEHPPGGDDVEVTLQVAAGAPHVFVSRFGQVPEADDALDEVARFIARHAAQAA